MAKFQNKYRIESNRLQSWDYSAPGNYFVTICITDRKKILGEVINGEMVLSEYGKIVESEINKLPEYHKRISMDEWIIMPNHIHMIITLCGYNFDNGVSMIGDNNNRDQNENVDGINTVEKIHEFSHNNEFSQHPINDQKSPKTSKTIEQIKEYRKLRRQMLIPKVMGKFQQQTSKHMNILRNTPGLRNWQVNYHDSIIRNEMAYHTIRNYIMKNPQKWFDDEFNKE